MAVSDDEPRLGDKELEQSTLHNGSLNGSLSDGPAEGQPSAPPDEKDVVETGTDAHVAAAPAPSAAEPLYEDGRSTLQTVLIMVSLCSALFLGALDVTIVTVAIPTISADFHSTIGYTWIGSSYLLANAATAPSWGKISDIWGRKPVLLGAVAIFWVGSLLCAVSINMTMLIVARAVQGIGSGGIIILVNVCIGDLFSMRRRGQYYGFTGLVWAVAGGIGPVVGGALTQHATWRWCFYLNLPISGAGFVLLVLVLRLHNPKTPLRAGLAAVDWLGSAAVCAGTLLVLLGLTFGGVLYPWASPAVVVLIVVGALVLVAFGVIEARVARYPIIPLRLFRARVAVASFVCCFFHGVVFVAGSYYLPLYFQAVLGAPPLLSGVYVLPYSIGLSVASAATGIAIKKTGVYRPFIIGGFVLLALGFGLLADLGDRAHWAKIVLYELVAALGVGPNFQAPLLSLHTTVDRRDIASATATFGFVRQMATAISIVLGGVVFQNRMQQQHAALVATLGPDAAALLSGRNAAASVDAVATLLTDPAARQTARTAYWVALRTMFALYAALAGVGLLGSLFITQTTLSNEHVDHKTGLDGMRSRDDDDDTKSKKTNKAQPTHGDGATGVKGEV
ncbi:uncharacterized protein SPSK_01584 [Sporothrix schenckii 1099-18]|uniref:Efflux pump dotC n=1 Tax=Sporothrix schenckii 1099-18 TaxID=1397361 RepID=A0A0F2MC50_SPOSC|nr:uncharacterized protein SPSK_01584 [Sporothrix schenckii 1099-18]KJR87217.1 hypothetical protein SPSK_01584 [Sporothrix schenckii 1099-18]